MLKNIKVAKVKGFINPPSQPISSGDLVTWEIDEIKSSEALVAKSTDPNLSFDLKGAAGNKTLKATLTYRPPTSVIPTYEVPYSLYIDNGSLTAVSGGYLVIDTIGPPTGPSFRPHDEDEPDAERL
ncbi:MAG TPA: hypothetical protein VLB76_04715 [Thermoanaerobaculia bacterium]|jgi:hypothetical protein|nr:hypothetical protein [Thermoanaerobaculia bacterium]